MLSTKVSRQNLTRSQKRFQRALPVARTHGSFPAAAETRFDAAAVKLRGDLESAMSEWRWSLDHDSSELLQSLQPRD